MTYNPMANLKEFHDKFDKAGMQRGNRTLTVDILNKRRKLIKEEFLEVVAELDSICQVVAFPEDYIEEWPDMLSIKKEALAKELADLLYVVYGTAEELYIPLQEVFNAVHTSNMDKLWADGQVHYNGYGKIIKPPSYVPPDLSAIMDT